MNEWTQFVFDPLTSPNFMTFHDFFHDLFKFSNTFGFAVSFKNFKNFPWFRVFFDLKQFNRHKLKMHAVYSSLSHIVLALSSAATNLSYKTLIFHHFQGLIIKFHDFPGLEVKFLNSMNFPGFPWPEQTLMNECHNNETKTSIFSLQSHHKNLVFTGCEHSQ